jgi:hypothetical protein
MSDARGVLGRKGSEILVTPIVTISVSDDNIASDLLCPLIYTWFSR